MKTEVKSLAHVEFETKYRVEGQALIGFKQLLDGLTQDKKFLYVEGPDYFFSHPKWWFANMPQWDPSGTFARYREPSYGLDNGRRQVTWKYKTKDAKNSIQRIENNMNITTDTSKETVFKQFECGGTTFNCSIVKNCHIYKFSDATLVFYTVYDTTDGKSKKPDNFVEIEVEEDSMATITEDEAWAVIVKYEKIMEPLGVSAQKRLRKSLFEMYRRDK